MEFLIPKKGLLVRDPKTMKFLPASGAMKMTIGPLGRYWRRRLKDGSVIVGKPIVKKMPDVPKARRINKED